MKYNMSLSMWFWTAFLLIAGFAGWSVSYAAVRYVAPTGGHVAPFSNWSDAATNIQAAVDACADGDTVLVTNGVYNTGYRGLDIVYSNYYTSTSYYSRCRLMVTNDITIESVNGPEQTRIVGQGPRGEEAVRCAYLDGNITLSGFSLTGGHAFRLPVSYYDADPGCLLFHGGGALCLGSVVISNCIISDNEATFGGGVSRGTVVDSVVQNNRAILTESYYYGDWSNAGRGGGVYKSTVLRCEITGNCAEDDGAGAYDSTLTQCRITDNYGAMNGGGASACDLIDCFVANNRAISIVRFTYDGSPRGALLGSGGGAYACRLWNCTVINNDAAEECGGLQSCHAWNSIVYWNRAPEYSNYKATQGLGRTYLTNCCATPLASGAGNTDRAPALASLAGGFLTGSSVCRDSGNNAWVKTAEDLDGTIRTNNGIVDVGAYEYAGFNGTNGLAFVDFDVLFPWVPTGFVQRFESKIEGSVLSYTWELGDGTVVSNIPFVEHSYAAPGSYDVVLRADLGGWSIEQTSRVEVSEDVSVPMGTNAAIHFVSKDGGHVPPFTSWANAATTIQAAINASMPGDVVLVSNGVYRTGKQSVGGMPTRVAVTRPITVRSVNGPEGTTIEGGYCWDSNPIRCAYLFYDAQLIGFTLTNGSTWGHGDELYQQCGGGVFCEEGARIEDCRVMKNSASLHGGGIYQGTVWDTLIQHNSVYKQHGDGPHYGKGGGASGCYLQNCLIISNIANECGGGAVDSIVKGGLVQGNRAYSAYQYPYMCHYSHSDGIGGGLYNCRASNARIENNMSGNCGGGVADSIVRFSTISGNSAIQNYSSCMSRSEKGQGGGVCGGVTENCIISNNVAGSEGGGAAGAVLHNCLISDNEVSGYTRYYGMSSCNETYGQGGGVSSSRVVNCTVMDNRAEIAGGGAYESDLFNSIVCFNTSATSPDLESSSTAYCQLDDPGFVSRNNPHLLPGSSCINAGDNTVVAGEYDLGGYERVADGQVDIGAYEFCAEAATGTLEVVVNTAMLQVLNSYPMAFEALIDGVALGYMWYWGDGTFDINTHHPVHEFAAGGSYTIMFYAWNNTQVVSVPIMVTVLEVDDLYVSPSGGHIYPYDSWEKAATNIQSAADICGNDMTIWVTNGHYLLDSSVELNTSARLQSVNGPEVTVMDGQDAVRCVHLADSNAVIRGFSVTGGRADEGAGILAEGGLIEDCLIYANQATNSYESLPGGGSRYRADCGGGVRVDHGIVRDCVIRDNEAGCGGGVYAVDGALVEGSFIVSNITFTIDKIGGGGGVYVENATVINCELRGNVGDVEGGGVCCMHTSLVENCIIEDNYSWLVGGGVAAYQDSIIRNCLLRDNQSENGAGGWLSGSLLDHCTVTENVSNSNHDEAAGLSAIRNSLIRNSIIVMNQSNGDPALQNVKEDGSALISYTLADPLQVGEGNLAGDPLFIDAANGDFHLLNDSPCIDAGSASNSVPFDVDGVPRPLDGDGDGVAISDMGAYERIAFSYADASRADNSGDGFSWATAKKTIQAAVDIVDVGGRVWVTNGLYQVQNEIIVDAGLTIAGFNGMDQTVVDGMATSRCFYLAHSNAVIEELTIRNGYHTNGAGVFSESGGSLLRCTLLANRCDLFGGGAYFAQDGLVRDCMVVSNSTDTRNGWFSTFHGGGGVYFANGGSVEGSIFWRNESCCGVGGGMLGSNAVVISNCDLRNNHAYSGGGGAAFYAQCEMMACAVVSNNSLKGGGLFLDNSAVLDSEIVGNRSCGGNGGGIFATNARITRCVIRNNYGNRGAGLYSTANLQLQNSIVARNIGEKACGALYGGVGGLYARGGGRIEHTTIAYNGGYYDDDPSYVNVGGMVLVAGAYDVLNSVVYHNYAQPGYQSWDNFIGTADWDHSCSTYFGHGNAVDCITDDPAFVGRYDLHLQRSSPCIDAGMNLAEITMDYEGTPRPLDGDGDGVAISDMGAYELMISAADSDCDGVNDGMECGVYGTNPTRGDTDGDGQSDYDEIIARMNPNDSDSFFGVQQMQQNAGHQLVLEWPSSVECNYTVYHCESLTDGWMAVPGWTAVPGTGVVMSYTVQEDIELCGFYRVKSELNP